MKYFIPIVLLLAHSSAWAGPKEKAALEVAEYALQQFGRGAAKGGAVTLARQIEASAVRHGPEMFDAVRKVGPRAVTLVESAGAHGKNAARVLATHGEAGAAWVVSRPSAMNLVARHGDDAAAALVRHAGGIAEPVIATYGAPAARALGAVGPQAGRRLATLTAEGHMAKIGRAEELLEVVAKYGDRAAAFVWANKGALAVGAVMTAFLANPEPFLDGTKDVATAVAEQAVRPVAEIPREAVKGVVSGTNWTLVIIAAIAALAVLLLARMGRRPVTSTPAPSPPVPAQPDEAPKPEEGGVTSPAIEGAGCGSHDGRPPTQPSPDDATSPIRF